MPKPVLIVDDSRVALFTLQRLLEQLGLTVDTEESAESALEYLRTNALPGIMFLDHMMPGMDGFDALAAIKSNSRTASIPVVMYTSKDGAAYTDRALQLGAIDVLPKPPHPLQLQRLLERVALITQDRVEPVRVSAVTTGLIAAAGATRPLPQPTLVSRSPSLGPTLVKTTTTVFERAIEQRDRAANETLPVSPTAPAPAAPMVAEFRAEPPSHNRWLGPALYLLCAVLAVWFYREYRAVDAPASWVLAENAQPKAPAASVDLPPPKQTEKQVAPRVTPDALIDALAWAANIDANYRYDEIPLNDVRLERLRGVVTRLEAAGVRAVVHIEVHSGEFCLDLDHETSRMPNADALLSSCQIVRYPLAEAITRTARQTSAFARYLAEPRHGVRIDVLSYGIDRPLVNYPDLTIVTTAGEWNAIAQQNQRVQFMITPTR